MARLLKIITRLKPCAIPPICGEYSNFFLQMNGNRDDSQLWREGNEPGRKGGLSAGHDRYTENAQSHEHGCSPVSKHARIGYRSTRSNNCNWFSDSMHGTRVGKWWTNGCRFIDHAFSRFSSAVKIIRMCLVTFNEILLFHSDRSD